MISRPVLREASRPGDDIARVRGNVLTTRRGDFASRIRRIHDRGFQFHSQGKDGGEKQILLAEPALMRSVGRHQDDSCP